MTSDAQAPNRPDDWIRLGRRGDNVTIWRHTFHPTASCENLYEGRYDDPKVMQILKNLDSLTPPLVPPEPPANQLLTMLRQWQGSMGCPNAKELDRAVLLAAAVTGEKVVPPTPKPLPVKQPQREPVDKLLWRKLQSDQAVDVDEACRALSDHINYGVSQQITAEEIRPGILQLNIPITQDMIPEQTEGGVVQAVLRQLHKFFETRWEKS